MEHVKYIYNCYKCGCSLSGVPDKILEITSPRNKKTIYDLCDKCFTTYSG